MDGAIGLVTLWGALALISQIFITSSIFTFEHGVTPVYMHPLQAMLGTLGHK